MAELNDLQALATISTIADESEVKVILSNSCFKAQVFLLDKLRKESNRQKEICNFINDANLKLKAEIQTAEQQIISSLVAQDMIKLGNIELKKELLIAKGKKVEIEVRIKAGEKKYEDLWLESKNRYESLPLVQKLLYGRNKAQTLYNGLVNCKIQIERLENDINIKKTGVFELDKRRILNLANYVCHEMKRKLDVIQENSVIIFELTHEIDAIVKENSNVNIFAFDSIKNKNNIQLPQDKNKTLENCQTAINDQHFTMPKLQLTDFDLDINLEQLKIKKNVTFLVTQPKVIPFGSDSAITSQLHFPKDDKSFENEYLSLYYKVPNTIDNENRITQNYSKRKLINILDDIKLDRNEAHEILSKIDQSKLETVNVIVADSASLKSQLSTPSKQRKLTQENTKMEIIEISTSNTDNILMPPSQFLDMTQDKNLRIVNEQDQDSSVQNVDLTQSNENKNAVSFDIIPTQDCINKETETLEEDPDKQNDDTLDNKLNNSVVSEEDFLKIKNRILKERHLDLSPPFVYAKNNRVENKIITSKFFQNDIHSKPVDTELTIENKTELDKDIKETEEREVAKENQESTEIQKDDDKIMKMESQMLKQSVRGLLFNHGSQCIPDSLNVSINTIGCDEADPDYPQYIDSSLLLSPKELPIPSSNNTQIQSGEVPNFLSGFRKTGLFFFGEKSSPDQKTENTQTKKNVFNFNFGSEEPKNKGFFNMFN